MSFINPKSPSSVMFKTDAYKLGHIQQYPENTTRVYSNFTPRGSRVEGINHVVHFGLQAYLQDVLMDSFEQFFAATEDEVANDYEKKVNALLGPNTIGSDHIRALHRLGYVPLRFSAVPEGTLVPLRVPMFTVENTVDEFFWLTNYVETALSAAVWQPSTTATLAWNMRNLFDAAANVSSSAPEAVDFQVHDFSYRGMAGIDAAAASGAGHLLSFSGTDSLTSIDWIDYYYGGDNGFVAGSVPATEHAVMCAGGKDDEQETYERLLNTYPIGILSVVSDTWDYWNILTHTLPNLKEQIMARAGKLVIRPDSGDPVDMICGTVDGGGTTPEEKGSIELLWELFGGTYNEKGYKELDSHIGLIYGDSITAARALEINTRLMANGFASTNWVAGIGSYTYQYQTRDTFMSAIKATWVVIDGEARNIMKDPKTDSGMKKSATGRLAVLPDLNGELALIEKATREEEAASLIQPVWEDGAFLVKQTLADVRGVLKANTVLLRANGVL